jgi:Fe2+ or Zn2+ uptake regulation protein
MQPYIDYCKEHDHDFTVITCEGTYGNVHGVPDEVIERMKKRWENYYGV